MALQFLATVCKSEAFKTIVEINFLSGVHYMFPLPQFTERE